MPWLADHCFYRQPADSDDPALRFPVVPMTAICELMLDLAAETAPGLVPVALTDVRALRWLPAEPAHEVEVTIAEVDPSVDRNSDAPVERVLRITIEGFARGTVRLASGYPSSPSVSVLNDSSPRSAPVEASDLYEHRWMFHGPRYQGVTAISQWFENGLVGTIAPLPSPGAVLDCAGQLMGLWAMQSLTENVLAFPQRIAAMRFFGPRPEVPLRCQVAVTSVSDRAVGADMELGTDDQVWCRIESWEDRRFDTDELLWPFLRFPETRTVVERQEPGWWLLRERWGDSASRELLVRRYATAEERRAYEAKNPLAQRDWLLGRAAAKDAVRQWLWAQGSGPRFPVEVEIGSAESGAPCIVEPPEARHLSVSIAHTAGVAVVQLAEGQAAGIDIERVERRSEHMVGVALRRSEREVMDRLAAEAADAGSTANDVATTILWALKEATAKASGRGLQGRPKDWTVVEAGGGTARVIETTPRPPQPTEPEGVPADADWALRYQVTDLSGSGDLVVVAWIECPTVPARERAAVVLPGEPNERESIDAE
jgi:phosphopantetheinyl transferase